MIATSGRITGSKIKIFVSCDLITYVVINLMKSCLRKRSRLYWTMSEFKAANLMSSTPFPLNNRNSDQQILRSSCVCKWIIRFTTVREGLMLENVLDT